MPDDPMRVKQDGDFGLKEQLT